MINEIIGSLLQVLVFALLPFLVYVIKNRSVKGFLNYIGLKRSTARANYLAVLACLIFATPTLVLVFTNADFLQIMTAPESITGKIRLMGFSADTLTILIIIALFKTAFAEEILFRGFIAKRLMAWLGFRSGNLIQAILFGAIHTALFAAITSYVPYLILIFVLPAAGAYVSGYLNEKIARGSIIPGWISHAMSNIIAYSVVGFLI